MGSSLGTHATIALRPPPSPRQNSAENAPSERDTGPGITEKAVHAKKQSCNFTISKHARVTLNVSGFRYMTYVATLEKFPCTLLGNAEKRLPYYDEELKEYFFDRNKQVFELILYFYQSNGRLVCPPELSPEILLEEVEFFELGENAIRAVKEIISDEEGPEETPRDMPTRELQKQLWNLFEYPDSSLGARVLALISVVVIVASIVVLCVETMPEFQLLKVETLNDTKEAEKVRNHNNIANVARSWFNDLEIAFITWFTFEYIMRVTTSPRKLFFVRSFLNIIDLLAILPFYVEFALKNTISGDQNFSLAFLRILRLVRVFRIFKLSRHSSGLQILGMTLRKSLRELGLLIFFLVIGVVIFSSMVYYAEGGDEETFFTSIPQAFWWALVTMTTVGYGDMYPQSFWGKLVGSCCALCGVLAIALPVPVIVSNFDSIYKKFRSRKLKQQAQQDDCEKRKMSVMVNVERKNSKMATRHYDSPTFERKFSRDDADSWPSASEVQENGKMNVEENANAAVGQKRKIPKGNHRSDGNGNVFSRSGDAVEWFSLTEDPDTRPRKTHEQTYV